METVSSLLDTGHVPFLLQSVLILVPEGASRPLSTKEGFQVSETLKPVQKQELASVYKAALKVLPENGEAG